jgi:hypothetical protein
MFSMSDTPPEPSPFGIYLFMGGPYTERPMPVISKSGGWSIGDTGRRRWPSFWETWGGPGVCVVRTVPEPEYLAQLERADALARELEQVRQEYAAFRARWILEPPS